MGGCFPCLGPSKKEKNQGVKESVKNGSGPQSRTTSKVRSDELKCQSAASSRTETSSPEAVPTPFRFRELAVATNNFREDCFLGEGGFGRVYKGLLKSTGQLVAVKQLDRDGVQGNKEFLVEVLMLSRLHHSNLVNLIGYCADGDQRLLVYELMPLGSLEDHLHDLQPNKEPLDWNTRMKIAEGAAKGLEYLHDKVNPPVIYRDLKSSNILLNEGYHPKLSDFGLAKLGPTGDETHVSTRVMGTFGYCAPEYAMTGQLTVKSDVYSFGVVFLELITGRNAIDDSRPHAERNLVAWARPLFKDRKNFAEMADPLLQGRYPKRGLYQALAIAAMCLQEQAISRPLIGEVVPALSYLVSQTYVENEAGPSTTTTKDSRQSPNEAGNGGKNGSQSSHQNSPTFRYRGETSGESRLKLNELDEVDQGQNSRKDSPGNLMKAKEKPKNSSIRDLDREQAVAEAKLWGENWRGGKRRNSVG